MHKPGIWKAHVCNKFITILQRQQRGIVRQYSEQTVCKPIRQPRVNKFLEGNKAMRLTQEEKENLNTSSSKESELLTRKLLTNKRVPDDFISEFYPTFREELT